MSVVICWFMARTRSRARCGVRTGRSGLVPVLASSPDGETNSTVGRPTAAAGPAARTGPRATASTVTVASTRRRNKRRSAMTSHPQDIGRISLDARTRRALLSTTAVDAPPALRLSRGAPERGDHPAHRGLSGEQRPGGDPDVARFRRCAQLPDAHVFTQRPQREDGGEGDAEPGGDVPLRDGELVTLRDEPRGEAGAAARGDGGLADVGGGPGGGDPVGRGERGQVDDAA